MSLKKKPKNITNATAIDEKRRHAIDTYQEYEEEMLTSEEQNSKIPMILAFIAALSLIVLSVFAFSFFSPSNDSGDLPATDDPKNSCSELENNPVCAHNGKTYKNACLAEEAQVTISHLGACLTPDTPIFSGAEMTPQTTADMNSTGVTSGTGIALGTGGIVDDSDVVIAEGDITLVQTGVTRNTGVDTNTEIEKEYTKTFTGKTNIFVQPRVKYTVEIPFMYYYSSFIPEKGVLHGLVIGESEAATNIQDAYVVMKVYNSSSSLLENIDSKALKIVKGDKTFVLTLKDESKASMLIRDLIIQTLKSPK